MHIHKSADAEQQRTEEAPAPEGACAEAVVDVAAAKLSTDSFGDVVIPKQGDNAEGQPAEDEGNQAEVHGLSAVMGRSDGIDIRADGGHNHKPVNTKGQDGQQNVLQQTAVGLQLIGRSGGETGILSGSQSSVGEGVTAIGADPSTLNQIRSAVRTRFHNKFLSLS